MNFLNVIRRKFGVNFFYIGRFITKNKSTILYTAIYMRKERSKMHTLRKVKNKNIRGVAI